MNGFAVLIDDFYRGVWQFSATLPVVFSCAWPLLLGVQTTERKIPLSFDNEGNLRFCRIMLLINISQYVNDIARYISHIPGAQNILLVKMLKMHPVKQGPQNIEQNVDGYEPGPDTRNDPWYPVKEYFSTLGMTARIAVLSAPSHLATPKLLKYTAEWQGSLIVVDQETLPFVRKMLEGSSQPGKRQSLPVPVLVVRSDATSWLLHAEPLFGKVLIPVHDTTNFQHLLKFIYSIPDNREVVLLNFVSGTPGGEKDHGSRNGIEQRLNDLAETIHQCGRMVTIESPTGLPEDEIGRIAEKHRVSLVVAFDGGSWPYAAGSPGSIAPFLFSSRWLIPVLVLPAAGWIFDKESEPAAGSEIHHGQNRAERSTSI